MDVQIVRNLLRDRLSTAELMQEAAEHIEVSLATMYRYKSNPSGMPLGKLVALSEHLAFPIEGSVAWSKADVIATEKRRYQLENGVIGGKRYIVTPSFTVNCELSEFTEFLWSFDYGTRHREFLDEYVKLRMARRKLYEDGKYESYEIFNGFGYRDFFHRKGRFSGIPEDLAKKQLDKIITSLDFPHVHRRIYLQNTPELPIFSCFSSNIAIIRIDDFTVEFDNESIANELIETFNEYFDKSDLRAPEEVSDFLHRPDSFV